MEASQNKILETFASHLRSFHWGCYLCNSLHGWLRQHGANTIRIVDYPLPYTAFFIGKENMGLKACQNEAVDSYFSIV